MAIRTVNSCCGNNGALVEHFIGTAYDVVKTVYDNLGILQYIYDFLNEHGVLVTVDSVDELKALNTDMKYARVYTFSATAGYGYTDYLYVDTDTSGVKPNDPAATGSWIVVASSNSGGGSDGSGTGYIPWVYAQGSALGGETTIAVPADTVGVPFIVIEGFMNTVGYGFTYDVTTLTVTLAQPLEAGDEVVLLLSGTPAVPGNPNVDDWVQINWLYNGGSAVGGEQVIVIPYTFESVPAIYKNGARYYAGLASQSYTIDAANQRILLTEPLATNDRLIIILGGESTTLIMSDRTIQEVARAANVKDTETILSTNTTTYLNGMKVVYDVLVQKWYGLPVLPTNVYIGSVSNGQLTYNPGGITVDLEVSFVEELEEVDAANSNITNIALAIQQRRAALTSNTFRVCTWNVQAFASLPSSPTFDNARFDARLDNQQFVREHIEWLLGIGADLVGIQEFYGTYATKQTRSLGYTTVGSNWRMYPYIDSFHAIETVGKSDGRTGFIGGNMTMATRPLVNGVAHTFVATPVAEGTYRSWSRVEMDVNGTTVAIYNTHLTTDATIQVDQMAELVIAVQADTATRILLMGDWNNPNDTLFQPLVALGFTVSPQINSNNYPGGTWYYDRVIHRGFSAVSPPNTVTPPYELGDHKPVYLDLTL